MVEPLISIVIPVFNRSKTIRRAIDSVLNQNFSDFELIIIDDYSTDDSSDIIQSYRDDRIVYKKLENNSGAANARNVGIKMANGKYVGFLDSDDMFADNFLQETSKLLESSKPDIGFCWTAVNVINNKSIRYNYFNPYVKDSPYSTLLDDLRVGIGCGFVCKRQVFEKSGYLDSSLKAAEDTEFILRISKNWNFTNTSSTYVNVYQSGSDRMSRNYKDIALAYNSFLPIHFEEIDKKIALKKKFYYKMMWLNYQIKDKKKARYYLKKIPIKMILMSWKIILVFLLYEIFSLHIATSIHFKLTNKA